MKTTGNGFCSIGARFRPPPPEGAGHPCGGGAIAATLAACSAYGAKRTHLLEHTTSEEIGRDFMPGPAQDAVGYAEIVID